ncbi:multidrug ABC transporter ATP-binding protein [Candidatus Acidianus copahuensis]|uniref:Multidrug ABC transporter ATP-binding protein n=1 Tax=Candidatus Acidianus copahuensis TaxID=1160895 RepID=A0A031LY23_9CREN|nr:ABC transporter ATP-binding protein [Candidatus Acidianus copahuensis]EZQ12048.1 multidrug ABC transporter ATP-binding protein [Candidatus Acidianus copahuensis]
MISAVDLTKVFSFKGKKVTALDKVNFTAEDNTITALVGHNGAGKTTILKILSTLTIPTSGDAFVNGYSVTRDEKMVRKNIGLVTVSERAFYYRLTAMDNLIFFASLQNLSLSEAKKRSREVLDFVGLSQWSNVPYMKFSTGMQKKLALARSLLTDPPVLLMDEPTLGLDLLSARQFRLTLKELKGRKTILMSSHYLREVEELADKVILIKRGKIVGQGTLEELKWKIGKVVEVQTSSLTDKMARFIISESVDGYTLRVPERELENLSSFKVINEVEPNLDDIYVYFVGEEREDTRRGRSRPWRVREF